MLLGDTFFQLDNLELLAKQVVEGFIIGMHKSPFHGFSVEFAEHRLYNVGEPIKNIDWKVYGRTDKMFSKRYEEETNLRCQLVIDCSSSMYYPELKSSFNAISKIHFAVMAAACFQYLLKKQRDAVGLSLYNEKVIYNLDARSSNTHHQLIGNQLLKLLQQEKTLAKSATGSALHQIAESIHKRSLVIVLSDMTDNLSKNGMADVLNALNHLRYNKHEVIVFDIADKTKEIDFEFENRPYEFTDLETAEKIRLHPEQIKQHYTQQMQQLKSELKLRCGQNKIDLIEVDINKGIEQILLPYINKRSKMM